MKENKFTLVLVVFIIAVLTVLLVYQSFSVLKNGSNERKSIYVIVKSTEANFDFWESVRMGAEAAAKEFNGELIYTGSQSEADLQEQIEILDQAIEQKPDAIVLAAVDFKALVPMAEKAAKRNIPLITIDSNIDSDVVKSFIATDNISASQAAGHTMAELINKKGKVAIVSYVQGVATAIEREKGFINAISEYPNIEVIGIEHSNGDPQEAYRITKKIIQQHPDIAGIFGANQRSSEGVGRAIKEMKKNGKIKVVAFDSSEEQIQYIEGDIIQAVIVQKPFNMGYLGVKIALQAARGKQVKERIDTGFAIITKDNMYSPENQKLLFPFIER
jgi:ribose transport system substrate-binding protein